MKRSFILFAMLIAFLLFSCSSSHSSNDTDILPDSDEDTQDSETQDDDSDSQSSEIVDDYEETPDESSSVIDRYKRCYDEIPDEPYEGLFADPNLELQIKMNLWNKNGLNTDYELQKEDLEYLREVSICTKDLRGIEKLINLESIAISGGNVYDFTPLLKLEKLKTVKIDAGDRDCGNPFLGIFKVMPLNIVFENITCLDGSFSQLTNLEKVLIYNTNLKDISPVEQLVNLASLTMNNNEIEFLPKNIGNLQKLEYLHFSNNNIKDIELVKSLTNLNTLYCNGNKINDISPVTNLVNLIGLELNSNLIEEIPKEITSLKKLQKVDLSFNNIGSLPDLKGLDSLVTVRFSNNALNDEALIKIGELKNVRYLHLSENSFTKVPVLKNMKSVNILYISKNKIADLTGFADEETFPTLEKLYLDSNKIENVEALRNRKGLTELRIYKNCIKDISPLEELKASGTYIDGMNEQMESCEGTSE